MSVPAWVLTVMLVAADGSGTAILLDQRTGALPEFATADECNAQLMVISEQVAGHDTIDLEKSILRCEPKQD